MEEFMVKTHHWPELQYKDWKNTYETLHRWIQIVGKLRLCKSPCMNHSWHSTFSVTARGLTTTAIPDGSRNFTVEFDFISHRLIFLTSDGKVLSFALRNESVKAFYKRFRGCLKKLKIEADIDAHPNELTDNTAFDMDTHHCTYVPKKAHLMWQIMVRVNNVMNTFRSQFIGKSSPVHFFWGSFDLAVTRFSGKTAPEHPGGVPHLPDVVAKEAYSHEVSSCGFWPGNEQFPHAAFYSYAYPAPAEFKNQRVEPFEAYFNETLGEYILPYEAVLTYGNPEEVILSFFETTFKAATTTALDHWEKNLEESEFLNLIRKSERGNLHSPA
jgi:hypothetical protein